MRVAVVDYRASDAPAAFADSLHRCGFATLVNHPLSPTLVRRVQDEWQVFLESDAKWDYRTGPGSQGGYVPMDASETAVGAAVADVKEYFHWYPDGPRPDGPSRAAGELYRSAADLATELLGWLDVETPAEVRAGLSMPLADMLTGSHRTLLRILRYPPLTGAEPAGALRAAPHGDINLLTMLPAATRPGLQVQDTSGAWFDVPADPGSLVVNTGDMLARATGDWYPSTIHRVLLPTGPEAGLVRMSTPLFLHPADQVELAPGSTAFDFLRERIRAITGQELAG